MRGTVFVEDFDQGVMKTFGAALYPVRTQDGIRQEYAIEIPGVQGPPEFDGKVPVYFVAGRSAFNPTLTPCYIIRRTNISPAMQRGWGWAVEYDVPIAGTGQREKKTPALPFDLGYEVKVLSRGPSAQRDVNRMMLRVLRVAKPTGFIVAHVSDTQTQTTGQTRTYDAIVESTTPSVDILDLTARDVHWLLSFNAVAELDLTDPWVTHAIQSIQTNVGGV